MKKLGKTTDKIHLKEYEKIIFQELMSDEKFEKYIKENGKKELIMDHSEDNAKEEKDFTGLHKENVLEYLEEISRISTTKNDTLFNRYVGEVASIAFHFLRDGISYLDIVQEGNVGLINATEKYNEKTDGDFQNYKNYWVVREILIFIYRKLFDLQNEFGSYFKNKKQDLLYPEDDKIDINAQDLEEEEPNEKKIYELEKKILNSEEAFKEKENMVKEKFDYFKTKNRLTTMEINILDYFFGFGKDKRYSMYEIEQIYKLKSGDGEEIFKDALATISTVRSKVSI